MQSFTCVKIMSYPHNPYSRILNILKSKIQRLNPHLCPIIQHPYQSPENIDKKK